MKKLWVSFIVLATLGSIYPFNFQASELNVVTIGAFLQSCCKMASRGDILGNIILFIPIGFTGMLVTRPESSASRRFLFVCLVGGIVALALQVMQIFLPSRDENLQDVVWNLFGIAGGALVGSLAGGLSLSTKDNRADVSIVPVTLVGTWLIYRLIPFVPSFDLQLIKDSLKPVFNFQLAPVSIIYDVTAWLVIAYLLRHARRSIRLDSYLPLLIIVVFCLEVLIVDNSINFSNLVGATLAVMLWFGALRYIDWQERALVILLLSTVVVAGLAPFELRFESVSFNWLPFHGFLDGSMHLNTQSAAEKVFLYGSLIYLLWRSGTSVLKSILIGFSFVAIIEFAQTRFVGHTPEITDPLLVIFAAIALSVLERHEEKTAVLGQSETVAGSNVRHKRHRERWVSQSVNLREYQLDFIVRLSREMGASTSKVIRRIVEQFIKGLEQDIVIKRQCNTVNVEHGKGGEKWVNQPVNLKRDQFDFLETLSQEMKISVSGVTRVIITRFIDSLDGNDESKGDYLA